MFVVAAIEARGRCYRAVLAVWAVALVGVLAPSAVAKKKPAAKNNPVRVVLRIDKGQYRSNIVLGSGQNKNTYNETDKFNGVGQVYNGIEIPRHGHVSAFSAEGLSPQLQQLAWPDEWAGTSWEAFGYGMTSGKGGPYKCDGRLRPNGTPELQATPAGDNLRLKVPLVKDIHPANVHGGGAEHFSCSYYGKSAFVPAINDFDPNQFLEASISVPVAKLRAIKKGHPFKKSVSESDASKQLKDDCGNENYTCSQHLNWSGHVFITHRSS
jgi:hypothetical protein